MNTVAHVFFNVSVMARKEKFKEQSGPIILGALYPDMAMLIFYGLVRIQGYSESTIWSELYYSYFWQVIFKIPNSIPICLAAISMLFLMQRLGHKVYPALIFFASATIHLVIDLITHNKDAHIHFFPFSDYRFVSPISYWDPNHFGTYLTMGEGLFVIGGYFLFSKWPQAKPSLWILRFIMLGYCLSLFQYVSWTTAFNPPFIR